MHILVVVLLEQDGGGLGVEEEASHVLQQIGRIQMLLLNRISFWPLVSFLNIQYGHTI